MNYFSQSNFRVRLDWGWRGARVAAERGDVLVVVDVLSFSTATTVAIAQGAVVYPCAKGEDTPEFAASVGAEVAVHRDDVPAKGRFSLSPVAMLSAMPGDRIVVASPNGATCTRYGQAVPRLFVGCLLNAQAVADAVTATLAESPDLAVTVLACGERWHETIEDGDLRFALEDYLGAGAILSYLPEDLTRSPEAAIAIGAFRAAEPNLLETLLTCGSGIELIEKGYRGDVEIAATINRYSVVPALSPVEKVLREVGRE